MHKLYAQISLHPCIFLFFVPSIARPFPRHLSLNQKGPYLMYTNHPTNQSNFSLTFNPFHQKSLKTPSSCRDAYSVGLHTLFHFPSLAPSDPEKTNQILLNPFVCRDAHSVDLHTLFHIPFLTSTDPEKLNRPLLDTFVCRDVYFIAPLVVSNSKIIWKPLTIM
jgi:hypothetical protein